MASAIDPEVRHAAISLTLRVSYSLSSSDGSSSPKRALYGSAAVLDHLLDDKDCDVDLQNRLLKETPLHLAAKISDDRTRAYVIHSLLEAGADTK